jgi:hypothetical protein
MSIKNHELENIMKTSFVKIEDTSTDAPLHDYLGQIGELAKAGDLQAADVRAAIDPVIDWSRQIEMIADEAVGSKFFKPGYSTVVADEQGHLLGVVNKGNNIPKLLEYGPPLQWAMSKIGHERFATTRRAGSANNMPGYKKVSNVLKDRPLSEIPYGERHHIGGATLLAREGLRILSSETYAGTTGVIGTEKFRTFAADKDAAIRTIIDEAEADREVTLDNFDGNLFAGSLDSTLSASILSRLNGVYTPVYSRQAIKDIISRYDQGVNVH